MRRKRNAPARSCSTLVAMPESTQDGTVIFGKNSDRPVNEPQPLQYYPPADHAEGSMVKCTYITIPQAAHTYGCIGSRPYNLFGFEHGVNEHGVVIGNEQVTSRETPERQWGLIGMDLLRLALERARTAGEAVEVIAELLETYGSGGDPTIRLQYCNANYIIADYKEAYIFESCNRLWAAKKIHGTAHIGNIYDLGDDYDLIGENVVDTVVKRGWAGPAKRINISEAFSLSDLDYEDAEAYFRYLRQEELMTAGQPFTVQRMMSILRDHYEPKLRSALNPIFDIATSKIPTICSHPGGVSGCASAASVVCELRPSAPEPFRILYWGSMAPPCSSVFTPKFNIGWIPKQLAAAGARFDENSPWWIFTRLERYIELSYQDFAPLAQEAFRPFEEDLIAAVKEAEKDYDGDIEPLRRLSQEAFERSLDLARTVTGRILAQLPRTRVNYLQLDYFREVAETCAMPYEETLITGKEA